MHHANKLCRICVSNVLQLLLGQGEGKCYTIYYTGWEGVGLYPDTPGGETVVQACRPVLDRSCSNEAKLY